MAERPTSNFGANTEKNPKEECNVVLTRSQKRAYREEESKGDQSEEGRVDKEGEKEEKEKKEKEEKVLTSKTKSLLAREARKKEPPTPLKEPPYPLVPSKKNKE